MIGPGAWCIIANSVGCVTTVYVGACECAGRLSTARPVNSNQRLLRPASRGGLCCLVSRSTCGGTHTANPTISAPRVLPLEYWTQQPVVRKMAGLEEVIETATRTGNCASSPQGEEDLPLD